MEQITEDALHMRTLSALLESIHHRRDANLQKVPAMPIWKNFPHDLLTTSLLLSLGLLPLPHI